MSLEHGPKKYGTVDKGTYLRTRHKDGSYWHGRTDVITISPKEKQQDAPHHIFVPGYSANGNPKISEAIATSLALSTGGDVDVFTVSGILRGRRLSKQTRKTFPHEPKKNNVRKTCKSSLEMNRAALLLQNLKDRGIRDAHVLPHSLGMQSAALAISLDTEGRIKGGLGTASAGVNEKRPVKNILVRFSVDSMRESWQARKNKESKASMSAIFKSGASMLIRHPLRFVWHEIRAAKYGNVTQTVIDANANLHFLAGSKDAVFGASEFSEKLKGAMTVYEGGHNRIYTDPSFVKKEIVPLLEG